MKNKNIQVKYESFLNFPEMENKKNLLDYQQDKGLCKEFTLNSPEGKNTNFFKEDSPISIDSHSILN